MAQAMMYISRELWRSICAESPTVENVAQMLLLPQTYRVRSVFENVYFNRFEVLVESDLIPVGTYTLTPVYQVKYFEIDGQNIRREVTFGHMQMS